MRTLLLFVFICGCVVMGRAQQNYFVYLQTDNKQAFYVRVNEKLFSSSSSGYVVIPKLSNGTHVFSVGFPKNEWPLQVISVSIANKDQGYILKNFESKGWGLFNLQTLDVLMANANIPKGVEQTSVTTRTDAFSNTLADVVNTPSIKEISKEETKVKEVSKPVEPSLPSTEVTTVQPAASSPVMEVPDSTIQNSAQENTATPPAIKDSLKSNTAITQGIITKVSESATTEALYIRYLVQDQSNQDTIEIIIPVEQASSPILVDQEPVMTKDSLAEVSAPVKKDAASDAGSPKFIDIELTNPNTAKDTVVVATMAGQAGTKQDKPADQPAAKVAEAVVKDQVPSLKMINSDCKSTAGEEDFLKARKKMIAQKSEDQMISAAQKFFRQRCYSTEQVKNLSTLLLVQENKYKFFDMAYPFVYDTTNFKELESQLTDPYFLSRFRAMIRN